MATNGDRNLAIDTAVSNTTSPPKETVVVDSSPNCPDT